MKNLDNLKLKQTVNVSENQNSTKKDFTEFLRHFNTISPLDTGFFSYDDRRMDYQNVHTEAIKKGITAIPTEDELTQLL